jgi:hypothetical protein
MLFGHEASRKAASYEANRALFLLLSLPHRKELTQKKPVPCWRDREEGGMKL